MMNYVEVFEKIDGTDSLKEKEQILLDAKGDDSFRSLLRAALDPYRLYQFNKVPCKFNPDAPKIADPFNEFMGLLKKLEDRKITGNNAKEEVIRVLSLCNIEYFRLFAKILIKGSVGIGIKSVNKAYGKTFLPEFNVMLAPNELANITDIKYPAYIQPKLDGFRCVYIPNKASMHKMTPLLGIGVESTLWSRKGRPFPNKNLTSYFETLGSIGNYVLDGELYNHDVKFDNLVSILNTENAHIPKGLKFVVYDCVPFDDWKKQKCTMSYEDRLRMVRALLNDRVADYQKVIDITNDIADTPMEASRIYKKWIAKGYEGVMIKDMDGKYQWKRVTVNNGAMLKLKPFKTVDLKVTGTYEGEGNFEGTVGGIIVDYNGVAVRCGSGFTLVNRAEISKNTQKYIGKTAEIKYFEETNDKSLRFPTFIRWRDDK